MISNDSEFPLYVGYIACFISVILFGSNLALVKKYDTGDGFFFNWVYCSAIWITGLLLNIWQGNPQFYSLAMVGGIFWATGGLCVSVILKTIGLGLGVCIWATLNLLVGWACGRFGLFGLRARIPHYPVMNYTACVFSLISALFYLSIKSHSTYTINNRQNANSNEGNAMKRENKSENGIHSIYEQDRPLNAVENNNLLENSEILNSSTTINDSNLNTINDELNTRFSKQSLLESEDRTKRLDTNIRNRFLGSFLAIIAGTFFGVNFVPVIYIQDNYPSASKAGLPYIFAHFSGIYLCATLYFLTYCIIRYVVYKKSPWISAPIILPTFLSGFLWAIATCAWFVANEILSQTVSFPIIASLPPILAGLWALFVFNEIKGRRNIVFLVIAFGFSVSGALLSALSF